jgi:hypothetical protein
MPERGRVRKALINMQTGAHLACCWEDCRRDGVQLHQVRVREGESTVTYVFCSERHKQYYLHSHVSYGNLPAGYGSVR